jgi:hypothetical protein
MSFDFLAVYDSRAANLPTKSRLFGETFGIFRKQLADPAALALFDPTFNSELLPLCHLPPLYSISLPK